MNDRYAVRASYNHPDNFRIDGWNVVDTRQRDAVVATFDGEDDALQECVRLNGLAD